MQTPADSNGLNLWGAAGLRLGPCGWGLCVSALWIKPRELRASWPRGDVWACVSECKPSAQITLKTCNRLCEEFTHNIISSQHLRVSPQIRLGPTQRELRSSSSSSSSPCHCATVPDKSVSPTGCLVCSILQFSSDAPLLASIPLEESEFVPAFLLLRLASPQPQPQPQSGTAVCLPLNSSGTTQHREGK